jgi:ribonucleoside-triphosphate reductase
VEAATAIGTLQASYTDVGLCEYTTDILKRDALLGVSITGIMDNPDICLNEGILRRGADRALRVNATWANMLGINPAARICTVKPSGTASLLLNCSSGIHPHHAKRYYRRVTANPLEQNAQRFREANPHAVELKPNGDWALVFPIKAPEGAITQDEVDEESFLKCVKIVRDNWVRVGARSGCHNVSATLAVKQWSKIGSRIWEEQSTITVFPKGSDMVVPYAPRETAVDDARWAHLVNNMKGVKYDGERNVGSECEGRCEVR